MIQSNAKAQELDLFKTVSWEASGEMYYYLHLSLNLTNVEQFSHSGATFGHLDTRPQILEVPITLHSVITGFSFKESPRMFVTFYI